MRLFAGPLAHAVENARLYAAQKRQFVDTVTALAEAIEKRDPYTGGHVRRVVSYSLALGAELGLNMAEARRCVWRRRSMTSARSPFPTRSCVSRRRSMRRSAAMQRHTVDGAEIVTRIRGLRRLLPGVRSHHERVDGRGCPDGLAGDAIPPLARIIAVADTYDAMTTNRPYRQGLTAERAAAEIRDGAGSQFAPEVAAAFAALYQRGGFTLEAGEAILRSLSEESERE